MTYQWIYKTPTNFDDILMQSDGIFLTGLWFVGSKGAAKNKIDAEEQELPIFKETSRWLDLYFSGYSPNFTPLYKIEKLTPFRKKVIQVMRSIPYGSTLTYKDIAQSLSETKSPSKLSSRAVGGAVGWNPLSLIIPCHRVVGKNGNITGYSGGLKNKIALLAHEQKGERNKYENFKKNNI